MLAVPASAQTPFFKDKTITVVTSTGAGGTYDITARAVARYMPKYIPGQPTMVVQNMPGGGNVLATNHMFNIAPKDGTAIATLHTAMPLHQALGGQGVRFDAARFNWLGSMGPENSVVFSWKSAGIRSFDDLKSKEVVLGGTGAGSGIVIFPIVMNKVLGTRFKIVTGYKSSDEVNIAMERGEVAARTLGIGSLFSQNADWIRDGKIDVLAQIGEKRDARLAAVPLLTEIADNDEQRAILRLIGAPTALGKPFCAPPDVPADRVALLRQAFDALMKDAEFLADMKKRNIDIDPMGAAEVAEIVRQTVGASADVVARTKAAIDGAEAR